VPAARLNDLGVLLADQTRCSMLTVLMDGRAWTAGELARLAGVAPSTASEHLSRLLDARFVEDERQGRHRYFRLAGPQVAELLESLGSLSVPGAAHEPRRPRAPSELRAARSCYDHLAGRLGVQILDRMLADGHLARDGTSLTLTQAGEALLSELGVDVIAVRQTDQLTKPIARTCLDWTERRHHLAGSASAALFQTLLTQRWLRRGARPRSVLITNAGQDVLHQLGWIG
jgi:DNA-binding transcriptional ArsR family regulator